MSRYVHGAQKLLEAWVCWPRKKPGAQSSAKVISAQTVSCVGAVALHGVCVYSVL